MNFYTRDKVVQAIAALVLGACTVLALDTPPESPTPIPPTSTERVTP